MLIGVSNGKPIEQFNCTPRIAGNKCEKKTKSHQVESKSYGKCALRFFSTDYR